MTAKLKIRKLKRGEEAAVSRLCRRCIKEFNSKDMSKAQAGYLADYFSVSNIKKRSREVTVYVAVVGDTIVATGAVSGNYIRALFVHPSYHGQGIGAQLVKHLEAVIKKAGHAAVLLRSSNYAVEFYKKLRYKKIKTLVTQEVGTVTMMKKSLKHAGY